MLEYCNIWNTCAAVIPSAIAMTSFHVPSVLHESDNSSSGSPSKKRDISILLNNTKHQHMEQMEFLQSLQEQNERHNMIFHLQSHENNLRVERQAVQDRRMEQQQSVDNWQLKFLSAGESDKKFIKSILDRQEMDLDKIDHDIQDKHEEIAKLRVKIQALQEQEGTASRQHKKQKISGKNQKENTEDKAGH